MTNQGYLRIVWFSALYDLVVTIAFATPWTARLALAQLGRLHQTLGASGAALLPFATIHLFFVSLFGTVVVMWSLLRLLGPRREHELTDGFGRLAFSAWMIFALTSGESRLFLTFLVPEVTWGIVELVGYVLSAKTAEPVLASATT